MGGFLPDGWVWYGVRSELVVDFGGNEDGSLPEMQEVIILRPEMSRNRVREAYCWYSVQGMEYVR